MRGGIGENIFSPPTKYYSTLLRLLQKPAIFLRGMIYRNVTWGALRSIIITSIACFSARVRVFCVGIGRSEEFRHY